jgi:signal transduction histidine kinase
LSEGLGHALDALVRRVRETTGVRVEADVRGLEIARPDRALELTCYRVVQEALNNAIRHARATEIALRVEADERLIKLRVRDNGVGFEARTARRAGSRRSGVGLNGMVERTRLAGGRLKVRSVPGTGTHVTAIFPLIVTRS